MISGKHRVPVMVLFLAASLSGCSEERPDPAFPYVAVHGQISRDGKPVSSGWIEYVPVDGGQGTFRSGPITQDGSYRITGLGPGLHGVRVIVPRDKSFFPFDQFFSPIRRTLGTEASQEFDLNLSEESQSPK